MLLLFSAVAVPVPVENALRSILQVTLRQSICGPSSWGPKRCRQVAKQGKKTNQKSVANANWTPNGCKMIFQYVQQQQLSLLALAQVQVQLEGAINYVNGRRLRVVAYFFAVMIIALPASTESEWANVGEGSGSCSRCCVQTNVKNF